MFTPLDHRIIRALQEDLPVASRPYAELAQQIGITEAELLAKIGEYLERGIIRKMGAILRHRQVGFTANALGVWKVPDVRLDQAAATMAAHPMVSHCYSRVTYPHWPYNLYTMIHAASEAECHQVAEELAARAGVEEYRLLFSTQELKKASMRYFLEEEKGR